MKKYYYGTTFIVLILLADFGYANKITNDSDSVLRLMHKVATWQLDSIERKGMRHGLREWTSATLFTGLMELSDISKGDRYERYMRKSVGEKYQWKMYQDKYRYYADNYCVGQLYCWISEKDNDPTIVEDLITMADTLVLRPHDEDLAWRNDIALREWAWCDALFMGPPALAMLADMTGNYSYLDLTDRLWWKTTAYLYDEEEKLYFRDQTYFDKREENGAKVFWSRGNGWVLAGLVRVLDHMPQDYSSREKWEKLYKDMIERIVTLQQTDGFWRTSLLHPERYPAKETSGTALYLYAITWGINNGLLEDSNYRPYVERAWGALVSSVHDSGKLGYVQQVGEAPGNVKYDDTEIYGVGAFLLAGAEVFKLAKQAN